MIFKDVVLEVLVGNGDVVDRFAELYNQGNWDGKLVRYISGLALAVRELKFTEPVLTNFQLVVRKEVGDGESYTVVTCLNLDTDETFALDFIPWNEVLGMQVVIPKGMTKLDYGIHVMWELTFYGWSNEDVQEKAKEVLGE
jgi:hypothetical protein